MRILVTGGHGQVGRVFATRGAQRGHDVATPSRNELDVCAPELRERIRRFAPDVVINAAAYTGPDRVEANKDVAFAINADGAGRVANECASLEVPLIHISTDYVFDGKGTRPYREDDPPAPLGVYGASKAAGEALVAAAGGTIVRTAWVFSAVGTNFVKLVVRLASEQKTLRIVRDQVGCPTWAGDLVDALLSLSERAVTGLPHKIYHVCGDSPTSWYGFANAIVEHLRAHREIACSEIKPIQTSEFPTAAARPAYSVLDTSRVRALGIEASAWQRALPHVVAELVA